MIQQVAATTKETEARCKTYKNQPIPTPQHGSRGSLKGIPSATAYT